MHIHPHQGSSTFKSIDVILTVRSNLWRQIKRVTDKVYSLLRKKVWRLESDADEAQEKTSVLFVGNSPEMHYIGRLFYKKDFSCRLIGNFWLWQILFPKKAWRRNSSFCVFQTRWPIARYGLFKKWFCLPTWVNGSVDLTADFRKFALKSKSAKNTLRRINKANFKVEISSDPSLFDDFYHQFHQPYMENRHGNSSVEESYGRMKARFLNGGELLFVSSSSQKVAACMLQYKNNGVTAYRLGVRDGDFSWVTKGAISALYFHMLTYCRLQGYDKLNLGGSRPFFTDGVLNYKLRNWNMKIDDHLKHFYFLLKPLAMNSFTKSFLCSNPFVSLKKDKMVANAFVPNTMNKLGSDELASLKTKFADKGLKNLDIHYGYQPKF